MNGTNKLRQAFIWGVVWARVVFAFLFFSLSQIAHAETEVHKGAEVGTHPIKIGAMLPLSGPFARYGNKIEESISKLSNPSISFIFDDEGCDPTKAVTTFKKLSELDGIHLFLGPMCGSPQGALAPLFKSNNYLALLGNSAPEAIFDLSGGNMFSTQPSIEAESTYLAQRMNELGVKTVMIIFRENQFSRAHEAAFRAHYSGKIFETLAYNTDDISELKSIALRVKQKAPEALYVPDASPLLAGLFKELRGVGVNQKKVFSVYPVQSEEVLNVIGKDGEGMIYSYPDIGEEDAIGYFPTLAAKMLSQAVSKCGENTKCVKDQLISSQKFDAHGALTGKLILKTIRDGRFRPLS